MSKKKIQISTVEVKSNVEAIFMNSNLVGKVIRAEVELEAMRKMYDDCPYPSPETDAIRSMISDKMVNTFKLVDELYEAIAEEPAYKCSLEKTEPEKKDETKTAPVPAEDNCAI